jgi:hypothetical protein
LKRNKCQILLAVVFMVSIISGLCIFAAPAAASTTTYSGSGNSRTVQERADRPWSGYVSSNNSLFQPTLPGTGWGGYQLSSTFTNIARNADYLGNGAFTGSASPWTFLKTPSGSASYAGLYTGTPPSGTQAGSSYVTLKGNSTVLRPISNMNFTSSSNWAGSIKGTSGSGTFTSAQNSTSLEWQEKGTYTYSGSSPPSITSATAWCNQSFTYTGSVPPQLASLNYKFYVKNWANMANGSMTVKLILTSPSSVDNTIFTYYASSVTSKPSSPTSVDITSYITGTGTYTVKLYAYIFLSVWKSKTSTACVSWDDVGVYITYGKYSAGSHAEWSETSNFGQYATANGLLAFKYWTNITTLAPSTDSYISAWVNSTPSIQYQYNITAFSSLTTGSWQSAALTVPASVFNGSSKVTIKVGLRAGSILQINSTRTGIFYFDNVTFYIKYKPTPASIKLGIQDDTYKKRWNDTETTIGSGTLTIKPSSPWNGTAVQYPAVKFYFVTNGTNGKTGYNSSIVSFTYSSTMYARHWSPTNSATFTVSDDTRTLWTLNYDTPDDIGNSTNPNNSYNNYNVSVYVPADWLLGPTYGISQITFGGIAVTTYTIASINSTTSAINIPASVFAPDPPISLLVTQIYGPNYVGPTQLRTLLFTQGDNGTQWMNATSFVPGNTTKLWCYLRNGSGGIPSSVASSQIKVRLYNESGNFYIGKVWTGSNITFFPSNCTFYVKLNRWNATNPNNSTWHDSGGNEKATYWRFVVNWTNGYEAANGIARFTTNSSTSILTPTTLTSPKQPYLATYLDGFTLIAMYTNSRNSTGIMGASVIWRWNGTGPGSGNWSAPMPMTPGKRGNYTSTIDGPTAYTHFAPQGTWIQVNASRGGFVSQSVFVRVFVRDIATTGSSLGFSILQTYAWNSIVSVNMTYFDIDHGFAGIAGAKLYANNTWGNATMMGSSGIGWSYRYLGSGVYQMDFKANTTRTGTSSWFITIKANKSHYQSLSVNLNYFNIRDRYTSHSEPYLSVTTPWNDTAIFLITYRDTDEIGNPPVFGATATCTWSNPNALIPYIMTPLGNGTYMFSLNVTGLAPSPYSFSFSFSKSHWVSITGISAQVVIRSVYTDLSSPSTQINVYWGDNVTVILVYKDLDHNLNISTASWNQIEVYEKQTGADYTGSLIYNIRLNSTYHSWKLTVNGSLPVGNYTLWILAYVPTAGGYYQSQWIYPVLNIKPIAASLTQKSAVLTVVWSDTGKIVVSYNDTVHSGKPIDGAGVSVLIDPYVTTSWYDNGTGIYTIFFNTTNEIPRTWGFTIQFFKTHYDSITISSNLQINPISTNIAVPTNVRVAYGDPLTFTVYFEDLNHVKGIVSNPAVFSVSALCNWTQGGTFYTQDFRNGTYLFSLDSTLNGAGLFLVQVNAYASPYYVPASQIFTVIIRNVNTSLAPHSTPALAPWGDNATVSLDYYVNGTTAWVTGATIVTNWTLPYTYSLTATGQWQIDFSTTGLSEGNYSVSIEAMRHYYQNHTIAMILRVRPIRLEMRLLQIPDKVQQGNIANITIQLWDLDHLRGVTGASLAVSGLNSSLYEIKELANGYYELDVNTASISFPANVSFTVGAVKSHYLLTPGPGQVLFQVISPGLSTMTVIIMSASSAGIVIIAMLGIVAYRRSKIPFIVKKIDQSIKLINKGTQVEAIGGVRTRVDTPFYLISAELESLGISLKKEEPNNKVDKRKESREKKSTKTETKPDVGSKDEKPAEGGS